MIDFCWANIWDNTSPIPWKINLSFPILDWCSLTKVSKWSGYYNILLITEFLLYEDYSTYQKIWEDSHIIYFDFINIMSEIQCYDELIIISNKSGFANAMSFLHSK